MTDARRRLLEAVPNQGAQAERLAELLGDDYDQAEVANAVIDGHMRIVDYQLHETDAAGAAARFAADPDASYHLTERGARDIGRDPNLLIG